MEKKIIWAAILFLAGTVTLAVLYKETADEILLSLAITFGTITYHFVMRLLIGLVFRSVMRNRADYGKQWYRVGRHEMALYEKLKVKD